MMKAGRFPQRFALTVTLIVFLAVVPSIAAEPMDQGQTCFGTQGCREPVNPEESEYYSVQCDASAIYVWRDVPSPELVTLIGIAQVAMMSDGSSFVVTGDVTVTRNGDTIMLSGTNGNLAPQPGEKSFSIDQCSPLAAALSDELIFPAATLTDAQTTCMRLPSEAEIVECSERLACEDPTWSSLNPEVCDVDENDIPFAGLPTCENPIYFISELRKCLKQSELNFIGVLLAEAFYFWYRCVFGSWPVAALVLLPSIRWWKHRQRR